MIISRTSYRISFFGGGSDYPEYYLKYGGKTLTTTIDKYCYVSVRELPAFYEHKLRVVYSKVEEVQSFEDLKHTVVREALRFLKIPDGLEIHHCGDLPARSGMGSSSAFAVGLLNAINALGNHKTTPWDLARSAFYIERDMTGQTTGWQDQVQAAYGGLNIIRLDQTNRIAVEPVTYSGDFEEHMMLFFTGVQRLSISVTKSYNFEPAVLEKMVKMVDKGLVLLSNAEVEKFAELLHEAWKLKKKLSSKISSPFIDDLYKRARRKGAIGGKILGAGGGGFLLLMAKPEDHEKIKDELGECVHVPFRFSNEGSKIIYRGDYERESEGAEENSS